MHVSAHLNAVMWLRRDEETEVKRVTCTLVGEPGFRTRWSGSSVCALMHVVVV